MELHVEKAAKWYYRKRGGANRFYAVEECSLDLYPGTLTVLTGRSGSGKTTLLHMLGTLLKPDEGSIRIGERDVYALGERELSRFRNQNLGIIPQGYTALRSLTVLENILLPASMYQRDGEEKVLQEALRLLKCFGMEGLCQEYPEKLSGGELRRLAIARAMAGEKPILLADEPTGDLDDENTRVVYEELRRAADKGALVLVVTHERDAVLYADQCFHMNGGFLEREEREAEEGEP